KRKQKNISFDELSETFNNNNHVILEHQLLETFDYFELHPQWNFMYRYTFMSVESFNQVSKTQLHISEGKYVYWISSTTSEGEENISLALQDIVIEPIFDYRFRYYNPDFILVSEADYEMLRNKLDVYTAEVHWLEISGWKKSADAVNELENKLHTKNQLTPKMDEYPLGQLSPYSERELLEPVSKINEYNASRIDGGLLFFISTFLSILFFFATFILVYLNLFTDIEQERIKYRKLYKIGITKKEVKKIVTKELRILFFLAPIIGIILSYLY